MKTTKELLSQIKDTILNGSEEQAAELVRDFVREHINDDRIYFIRRLSKKDSKEYGIDYNYAINAYSSRAIKID